MMANLAKGLNPLKYDVHLGLVTQQPPEPGILPDSVSVHAMGARRVRTGVLSLLRLAWRVRPDIILSGIAHLNFLVLMLRPILPPGCRVIVRQNGPVSLNSGSRIARFFYPRLYLRADAVVCQTCAMAADLDAATRGSCTVRVLANPVDLEAIRSIAGNSNPRWEGPGPHLLTVGRLVHEKGFDLLIRAIASLRAGFPAIGLTIVGEGRERQVLEELARELGLEGVVRFAGHEPDPAVWFNGASIFVLSSRSEGMPNAMLEAAGAGLPIMATPATGGIAELLDGQPGVWLASDVSAAGIAAVLETAIESLNPGERFPHPWVEPFRIDRAVNAYEAMMDECLAERCR